MASRYFAELAYNGGSFSGWQNQPGQKSVQSLIEGALFTILRKRIEVVGCGRTDAGVHARQYYLHFDWEGDFPSGFLSRLNKVLGTNIAVYRIFPVETTAHARFNATQRSYEYHLSLVKNPFSQDTTFQVPQAEKLHFDLMQEAANCLLEYEAFFPFCKSNSDAKTMNCQLMRSEWVKEGNDQLVFHISANRFLRGMVRLIVGMSIQVGMKKLMLKDVLHAMDTQSRLPKSYSVPPQGLFLSKINYPFI